MTYIKRTLLPEENVLYHTRPHYIVFFDIFIWLILAHISFRYFGSFIIGFLLLGVGLVALVKSLVLYFCSEYVITNKRILVKIGFIRRQSLEIFLNRVEGVYIDQSILGRIFNYGTVIVAGIGGTKNPFSYIPKPLKFRGNIQKQMQKM